MGIKRQSPGLWQVFSETGVGAGYKLHTYTPGTTDDKLTYQDKDGSVNNANPVVFNARGEADIWFDGTYDLKLVDADDTLIWTISDFGAGEGAVNYGNYNLINDGGFEDDTNGDGLPDQWEVTAYPTAGAGAGVVVIDTTDQIEGAQSLKFTSVGDGGGYAVSNFFNVREGGQLAAAWMIKSTDAAVRNVVEIIWYTGAQVQISTSSLYDDSATNPTSWTQKSGSATAVTNARYAKIRIYGCHSSDATTGDTWFDAVQVVSDTIFGDLTIVNDLTVGNDLTVTNDATISGIFDAAGTFQIGGVTVTASAAELNYNDITTLGTAEASKTVTTDASRNIINLNSVTAAAFVGPLTGNASTASTITNQGALATLNSVAAAQIDTDAVGQSEIAADSVGQSEIKTTYQEVSHSASASSTTTTEFTATGGIYCIGHTFRASTAGGTRTQSLFRRDTSLTTSDVASWHLETIEGAGVTFTSYVRLYYINSSPPYDLGFGNIPLFIFLIIDSATQNIESVSISVDAPWHYNGPTDITPSSYAKDGTPFKTMREVEYELLTQGKDIRQELRGANRKTIETRIKNDAIISLEIDQAMKNADMPLIPHPFLNNDLTGKTVAVINPQSEVCETLLLLHERGESVAELIHNGDIIIGSASLNRGFDPSIKCVDVSWA